MNRSARISLLATILLGGLLSAILFHGLAYLFGAPYPYNTFLLRRSPADPFGDLRNFYVYLAEHTSLHSLPMPVNRMPLVIVYYVLSFLPFWAALGLVLGGFALFTLVAAARSLATGNLRLDAARCLIIAFCSYAFIFAWDRGNLEIVLFMTVYLGVNAFAQEQYTKSALWLGLAIALKPFAAVFLALFVWRRQWTLTALSGAVAVILYGASYAFLTFATPYAWNSALEVANHYNRHYVIGNEGLPFGHSAFGLYKIGMYEVLGQGAETGSELYGQIAAAMKPYLVVTLLSFLGVLGFLYVRPRALWRQVTVLVCAQSLLPYVSADYKLLHFLPAVFLFLRRPQACKRDGLYVTLFGLILIPKAYFHLDIVHGGRHEISSSSVLGPILILALAVLCLAEDDVSLDSGAGAMKSCLNKHP